MIINDFYFEKSIGDRLTDAFFGGVICCVPYLLFLMLPRIEGTLWLVCFLAVAVIVYFVIQLVEAGSNFWRLMNLLSVGGCLYALHSFKEIASYVSL